MEENFSSQIDASVNDKQAKRNKIISIIIWAVITVMLALGAFFFANNFIMRWPIEGASMEPNVHSNDTVLLFKTKNVNYGNVIVFYLDNADKYLIKRVIGKEGDEIKTVYSENEKRFHLYRNGELLDESYIKEPINGDYRETTVIVPEDCYYVLGDNRNLSYDSHSNIFCKEKNIQGIVFMRFNETDGGVQNFEFIESYDK